jgi:hypothetical protein
MATVTNLDTAPANALKGRERKHVDSIASFQRPADVLAYAAGDVISDSTSVAAVLQFPLCARIPGGGGAILRAHIALDVNIAAPPDLELYLFSSAPTDHLDNAALALADADLPKINAVYDLAGSNAKIVNAGVSPAGALYYISGNAANRHGFVCASGDDSLYALLVTRSALTPVSAMKVIATLELEQD